ncbi:succinyl-CoA synthetase subunit alpha, partial [Kouleothrix aurantiaca]
MSILVDTNTRLLVQGITGNEGTFHSRAMLAYGTNIVAGVTPGRGGQMAVDGKVPVFNTVKEAVAATGAN